MVLVVVLAATSLFGKRPLPGKLSARGAFNHEDPASKDAIAERKRDFSRIVGTRRDIWVFTADARKPGTVMPVELQQAGNMEDLGRVAYEKLKFWLQGELGKIPGAIDLGMTSQWPVVDRVINFISVTPGFDFLMQHKVPPMILQAKYVLMISKTGQVRAAWYAFATDKPAPGATSGPFIVKLTSEDLNGDRGGLTYGQHSYTAKATRETDMEKVIAAHLPLITKGIDSDAWDAYLKA